MYTRERENRNKHRIERSEGSIGCARAEEIFSPPRAGESQPANKTRGIFSPLLVKCNFIVISSLSPSGPVIVTAFSRVAAAIALEIPEGRRSCELCVYMYVCRLSALTKRRC